MRHMQVSNTKGEPGINTLVNTGIVLRVPGFKWSLIFPATIIDVVVAASMPRRQGEAPKVTGEKVERKMEDSEIYSRISMPSAAARTLG